MESFANQPTSELSVDLLFDCLRVTDESLNAKAFEILRRWGQAPIRRLLRVALNRKNRPAFRLRAIEAIRKIGSVTDPNCVFDLSVLLRDPHTEIRNAAALLQHAQTPAISDKSSVDDPEDRDEKAPGGPQRSSRPRRKKL